MSEPELRFRVARPNVIHQDIDGEVVVIHLLKGTYHSLRGSAAALFPALERGACASDLAAVLAAAYEADSPTASREAARFLEDLRREELVVEAVGAAEGGAARATPPGGAPDASARRPFEAPRIESFSDLQDLILADPIHEVDAAGWPHRPQPGNA